MLNNAQGLRHRAWNAGWMFQRLHLDVVDPVCKVACHPSRDLRGQSTLTNTAKPGERDQAFGAHELGYGPPKFLVVTPIDDEGASQNPDAVGTKLALRHVGVDAGWGSKFSKLAYLRGKSQDLATKAPEDDWLLKERVHI